MSPWEAAMAVPSTGGLAYDLIGHCEPGGYVLSTPDYFLLARPVRKEATDAKLKDPFSRWPEWQQNAWMIWLLCGDAAAACAALVAAGGWLPFVVWQNDSGDLRFRKASPEALHFLDSVSRRGKNRAGRTALVAPGGPEFNHPKHDRTLEGSCYSAIGIATE